MAVLNNIRKRGIFLIFVIAMALFAFILADLIGSGSFSQNNQNTIASINGEDVSYDEFSNRLQMVQQNSYGNISTIQAVKQVWDATLQQKLIEEQIDKLGIDIGNAQLNSALAMQFGQSPDFQTNGQFDINKFKGYIEQLRASSPETYQQWLMNEDDIAQQAKAEVYFDLLGAGLGITSKEAKEIYKLNNTLFDLQYVRVPYSAIPDKEVEVSDSEIKAYINTHKEKFNSDGLRDIRYVLFEEKPTDEDVAGIKQELSELLKDRKVMNKAAGVEEEVKGFSNTTDYGDYLAEYSDLPYEDFYRFKKDLPKPYADTLANLSKGDMFGPYEEAGYWKYTKIADTKQIPDSVNVKHILISYSGVQSGMDVDRTHAEAEQLADSILGMAKKDTDKFADLANEYSEDPGSAEKGGDLGWITYPKGESNDLIDFMFSHDEGTIDVVESQYGFHIAYIEETRNKQKAVKLATLAKKIEASEETQNDLFNQATTFQMDAKDGDFADAANKDSYKVRTVKKLKSLDENISGLDANRGIVQWAFDKETKTGDVTRFDTDKGYVVAQLTAKTSKGLQSVEEARDEIEPILKKEKKGEKIASSLSGDDMNEMASTYGTQTRTKKDVDFENPDIEGQESAVIAAAFSLDNGEVSKPIKGKSAVYVIKLLKKQEPEDIGSYNGIITRENEKSLQDASKALIKALKDKAEIEDNRSNFY